MVLQQRINKKDFYKKYYKALNGVLNLTDKQLEVLSEFSYIRDNLSDSLSEDEKNLYTFSSTSRNIICDKMSISKYNLNNFIKSLKDKGFLISTGDSYILNPNIYVPSSIGEAEITFKFKIV